MDEIDTQQAAVMKTLAHPRRVQILHRLAGGPTGVARLAAELGMSRPNTSQHLAVTRTAGMVEAERDGREFRYRLADPDDRPQLLGGRSARVAEVGLPR